jgi:DNA polymerase III delta subunit
LISIINTQLLNFKIYKLAKSKGWSDNDIINRLLFNQYTIMSYSNLHIDLKTINNLINELWLLEYNMKHNNLNQYLGFKFFLAK